MAYTNTTNYTNFKELLRNHDIVETDDVEAQTYQFRPRDDGKIEHRRKGTEAWTVASTIILAEQFLIGGMMTTARVG